MKYRVKWNYKSSLGGPWMKGDEVDLDVVLAGRINVDSPGVLVQWKAKEGEKEEGEHAGEPVQAREDRMVKEAKGRGDDPMTKATFKAVKHP